MSTLTVEAPAEVEVKTTIIMQPTPEQQAILNMIELVKRRHWCRNTVDDGFGHACMLGLIRLTCRS